MHGSINRHRAIAAGLANFLVPLAVITAVLGLVIATGLLVADRCPPRIEIGHMKVAGC